MVDIKILLNEFQRDMLQKFVDHDNKWEEKSVARNDWSGEVPLNEEQLRNEIHYHYAKWIYNGVIKKTMPEEDTLTNLANMIFMLWLKIQMGNNKINTGVQMENE
jgi:hypothetical protein